MGLIRGNILGKRTGRFRIEMTKRFCQGSGCVYNKSAFLKLSEFSIQGVSDLADKSLKSSP